MSSITKVFMEKRETTIVCTMSLLLKVEKSHIAKIVINRYAG